MEMVTSTLEAVRQPKRITYLVIDNLHFFQYHVNSFLEKIQIYMKKQEIINYYGSVAKAATELKLTVGAIYKWPEELSEKQARYVELASHGKIVDCRTKDEMGIK